MTSRHKAKSIAAPVDGNAYAVYWSIYTDLPGRVAFRKLYWDRLKDAIGQSAKLIGISREDLWPSGLPSHELRAEAWRFVRASSSFDIVTDTLVAAFRIAPHWRLLTAPNSATEEGEESFSLVWDRPHAAVDSAPLPFPNLTSILVEVHVDTGFGIRPGCILRNGERTKRSVKVPLIAAARMHGSLVIDWHMQVQTSTKQSLLETHWPKLQQRFSAGTTEMVDLQKRSGETGPFRFTVRQTVEGVTANEATVLALLHAEGQISRDTSTDGGFTLRGDSGSSSCSGYDVEAFEARWTPSGS